MAGNQTIYKSNRSFLPALWVDNNIPQSAVRTLEVGGAPTGLNQFPVAQRGCATSVVVVLSEAIQAGDIEVALLKNGTSIAPQTVAPSDGTTKVGVIDPGVVHFEPGDTIGVQATASAGLSPNAQIDLGVYVEMQSL